MCENVMAKMMQVRRYYTQNIGANIINICHRSMRQSKLCHGCHGPLQITKSFVAVSCILSTKVKPMCMILYVVEVAKYILLIVLEIILMIKFKSHSGYNLAAVFATDSG